MYYTVENLTEGGTFLYRVKALYSDGTSSAWSNIEEVTLFENGHGYALGDVNHDGVVSVTDMTELIDGLLDENTTLCPICSDVDQNGAININDVTTLIDILLAGQPANLRMANGFLPLKF
jgi:hypothetical protein